MTFSWRNLKVMFFETLFYLVLLHLGSDVRRIEGQVFYELEKTGHAMLFLADRSWILDSTDCMPRASVTLYAYNLQSQDVEARAVLICFGTGTVDLVAESSLQDVFESRIEQLDYWRGCDTDGNCRIQKAGIVGPAAISSRSKAKSSYRHRFLAGGTYCGETTTVDGQDSVWS